VPYGFPPVGLGLPLKARAQRPTEAITNMDRRIAPILTVSVACLGLAGCSFVSVVDPTVKPPTRGTMISQMNVGHRFVGHKPRTVMRRVTATKPAETSSPSTPTAGVSDLTAFGFASITAQSGSDAAQRRLQAARAAKLDAYRNLAEQLYGVEFASDSLINDSRVREDQIRVRISGVIAGAELVALEPLGNDSYQATVRLPADKVAWLQRR
jgi:hypothetical protein